MPPNPPSARPSAFNGRGALPWISQVSFLIDSTRRAVRRAFCIRFHWITGLTDHPARK